jgi:ribosomal-protein-alanine N-acetyltransferase
MPRVRLATATTDHLSGFLHDPRQLAEILETPIPKGWPVFPESFPVTLDILRERPSEAAWWMYFFLDADSGELVGSGGFAGPPREGQVEIGYEIAPGFRRAGYATAATRALIALARRSGEVDVVIAHTLTSYPASAGVLRASGFLEADHVVDPDHGDITRWQFVIPPTRVQQEPS